ncbi:sugar-binding domain-containing protein [uncultured Paracoccus sp.]|uniref:sugar-binding transcriptional regulator n=1 Tax=uncultured Paracoccus sp. TaxID=189685 RepID=UPI0025D2A618|nr:sugar-binding domain-containing protein [uncultured Paracoccus sp.]
MARNDESSLDLAARAGWLYYVGGKTQDQIAKELSVSRQRAQRMVARALAEGLVRVRLDHPIAALIELENRLIARYGLRECRVAPDPGAGGSPNGAIAGHAAALLETVLDRTEPQIVAVGTGRAIRAMADAVFAAPSPQHEIASIVGNIGSDGAATLYDVVMRIAEKRGMRPYPMPVPVVTASGQERRAFHALPPVKSVLAKVASAHAVFVGVGQMSEDAPLVVDGFITPQERARVARHGAAGEIAGHIYDAAGQYMESPFHDRVAGQRIMAGDGRLIVGIAAGPAKLVPLRAALTGGLLNAVVTDERTASALLD